MNQNKACRRENKSHRRHKVGTKLLSLSYLRILIAFTRQKTLLLSCLKNYVTKHRRSKILVRILHGVLIVTIYMVKYFANATSRWFDVFRGAFLFCLNDGFIFPSKHIKLIDCKRNIMLKNTQNLSSFKCAWEWCNNYIMSIITRPWLFKRISMNEISSTRNSSVTLE